jgi:hypothetical protein
MHAHVAHKVLDLVIREIIIPSSVSLQVSKPASVQRSFAVARVHASLAAWCTSRALANLAVICRDVMFRMQQVFVLLHPP